MSLLSHWGIAVTDEHPCKEIACPECQADVFPAEYWAGEPVSEGHVDAYWGDRGIDVMIADYLIMDGMVEACLAGEDGWVVAHVYPYRICQCGHANLRRIGRGVVQINRAARR